MLLFCAGFMMLLDVIESLVYTEICGEVVRVGTWGNRMWALKSLGLWEVLNFFIFEVLNVGNLLLPRLISSGLMLATQTELLIPIHHSFLDMTFVMIFQIFSWWRRKYSLCFLKLGTESMVRYCWRYKIISWVFTECRCNLLISALWSCSSISWTLRRGLLANTQT